MFPEDVIRKMRKQPDAVLYACENQNQLAIGTVNNADTMKPIEMHQKARASDAAPIAERSSC